MIRPTLDPGLLKVLQALAAGIQVGELAAELGLARSTVCKRMVKLYALLGVHDRAEAVAVGYRTGVLSVGELIVLPCVLADNVPLHAMVAAREHAGIGQRAVARQLGRSPAWLSVRENGRALFTVQEVREYARIVGFDLDGPGQTAQVAA